MYLAPACVEDLQGDQTAWFWYLRRRRSLFSLNDTGGMYVAFCAVKESDLLV